MESMIPDYHDNASLIRDVLNMIIGQNNISKHYTHNFHNDSTTTLFISPPHAAVWVQGLYKQVVIKQYFHAD